MKHTIVQSSDCVRLGRMDTSFHIARAGNQAMIDRLLKMPENEFQLLFLAVPECRDAVAQVIRRRGLANTKEAIEKLTREEQAAYVALVCESQKLEQQARDLEAAAVNLRQRKAVIAALMEPTNANTNQ